MKRISWQLMLGIALVALSAALYTLHYAAFRDVHHILIYLVGDVAFVPIEVLLVTLIIHSVLSSREKRIKLQKLNMVVGAFFSEVGAYLLADFSDRDPDLEDIRKDLLITGEWTDEKFAGAWKNCASTPTESIWTRST